MQSYYYFHFIEMKLPNSSQTYFLILKLVLGNSQSSDFMPPEDSTAQFLFSGDTSDIL